MAENTKQVEVQQIIWSGSVLYAKQKGEEQKDTFGSYLYAVALVRREGKKEIQRVEISRDGLPVEGALPTLQRQFIKLLLASHFTAGSKKGDGYADTVGLNLKTNEKWYAKMVEGGWSVEAHYGSNPDNLHPFYASAADLLALAVSLLKVRNSTVERFPIPEEVKAKTSDAPVIEKVAMSF